MKYVLSLYHAHLSMQINRVLVPLSGCLLCMIGLYGCGSIPPELTQRLDEADRERAVLKDAYQAQLRAAAPDMHP